MGGSKHWRSFDAGGEGEGRVTVNIGIEWLWNRDMIGYRYLHCLSLNSSLVSRLT